MKIHKRCCSCKKRLPVNRFRKSKDSADGLRSECKSCAKKYQQNYRQGKKHNLSASQKAANDKIKSQAYQKAYYLAHKEKACEYQVIYRKRKSPGNRFSASEVEYKPPSFEAGEFSNNYLQKLHGDKLVRAIEIKLAG